MAIILEPGQTKQVDVQLTPIVGPGELSIRRFFVVTRQAGATGPGEWEIHCHVRNRADHAASVSLHYTGVMDRGGGFDPRPIDVVDEFTVDPKSTHASFLNYRDFAHTLPTDDVWVKVDTSWGQSTRQLWFKAGYHANNAVIHALDVQPNSAVIRYGNPNCTDKFSMYLKTPYAGAAEHEIYEVCRGSKRNDCWVGCYFYAFDLLSGRQYYASCWINGWSAETFFNTP